MVWTTTDDQFHLEPLRDLSVTYRFFVARFQTCTSQSVILLSNPQTLSCRLFSLHNNINNCHRLQTCMWSSSSKSPSTVHRRVVIHDKMINSPIWNLYVVVGWWPLHISSNRYASPGFAKQINSGYLVL